MKIMWKTSGSWGCVLKGLAWRAASRAQLSAYFDDPLECHEVSIGSISDMQHGAVNVHGKLPRNVTKLHIVSCCYCEFVGSPHGVL